MTEHCSICFEDIKEGNIYGTECGHVFHAECIQRWKSKSNDCPNCRHNIGTGRKGLFGSPVMDAMFLLNFFANT